MNEAFPLPPLTTPSAGPRPGAGRPTREQAEQRHEELLDRALGLFLEKGYELATIDAIAAAVGMTKRTVYARYEDKKALFLAAVQRAVERWRVPVETLSAAESEDLEATLIAFAQIRMRSAVSPVGIRLQRILNTESYRFPEINKLAYEQGSQQAMDYLADLFARHARRGTIVADSPGLMAHAFATLMNNPVRVIVRGAKVDGAELDAQIRFYVRLFLDGARPR